MTSEGNYFKIGLFFVLGIMALVLAIVILAGGKIFERPIFLETYFEQSVQGLDIGSPVKYRGVKVGEVKDICIVGEVYHQDIKDPSLLNKQALYVMVIMALDPSILGQGEKIDTFKELHRMVAERGFRIRLEYLGVTGLAYLELDFVDDKEQDDLDITWEPRYPYVPSMSNTIQLVSKSLNDIARALSDEFVPFMRNMKEASNELPELTKNLNETLISLQVLLKDLSSISKDLPELEQNITEATGRINELLARETSTIEVTLENIRTITEDIRDIAATIKRHPSRLMFGKPPAQTEVK